MMNKENDETAWEVDETVNMDYADMDKIMEDAVGAVDSSLRNETSQAAAKFDDTAGMETENLTPESDIEAARAEAREWQDRYMRKAAEFENYRKRMDKEKSELRISAQSTILRDILPVLDGFDRALKYFSETDSGGTEHARQWREGVELLCRQVTDTLAQTGVAPIETEGKLFDPYIHEALSRYETSKAAEGTIVQEVRRGYMFKDSLLRPSQVIVAVNTK